jgi:uncharacterized membrane protein
MLKTANPKNQRVFSIDVLRGVVMIIMALDHVRDFFHVQASTGNPTNLSTTTPLLFFTRWITHFCAPTFLFLSGISAFLMGRNKSKKELSLFLIKRGFWLILVEVLIISLGWTFDPLYHTLILQVIWAIGISMIFLGILSWLPTNWVLMIGLAIIFFHNMLDYAEISRQGHVGIIWEFAHHGFFIPFTWAPHHVALLIYAFLPWLGIMLTGYGIGQLFVSGYPAVRRKNILFGAGTFLLLLFIALRFINMYGDPVQWSAQRSPVFTILSFLNVSKYPPSLDYISLTIGTAFIALALLDRIPENSFSFAKVFGRVPFFYYVLHIYLIHIITVILFFAGGYGVKDIVPLNSPFLFRPDHFGFGLFYVYLIWAIVILILYRPCKWYNNYKNTHKDWWLSYL